MSRGTGDSPADFATLAEFLRWRSTSQPDRVAYTFLRDGETDAVSLTYGDLDHRARALAAAFQSVAVPGERALLLYPSGLEFITALFGCFYAGIVAVPAYPPEPARAKRTAPRLRAIVGDSAPRIALTEAALLSTVDPFLDAPDGFTIPHRLVTDEIGGELAGAWRPPAPARTTPAFLQYTSGSTAVPKGVMISHANVLANARMIREIFGLTEESVGVGWLPLYHDMGLVGSLLETLYVGGHFVLMSPLTFLQRPVRWLKAVSGYRATISGGPDFAYDLCARRIPLEERSGLDLSCWSVAFNGAEPIRRDTLDRYVAAFGPCGFRREAFYPCYGLAEATLLVTAGKSVSAPGILPVDRRALGHDRITPAAGRNGEARTLVSCGLPPRDVTIAIVDPRSSVQCPADRVGEVWVRGGHVARGYWNRPAETEVVFAAHLADTGDGPFLRTGDRGFLHEGELFITGREKDLILVRGANYYPEDLEATVEQSHPILRPQGGAAFSVEGGDATRVVIGHEVVRSSEPPDLDAAIRAIRRTLVEAHELQADVVLLLRAGSLPRTSSGKVQRHACAAGFLAGTLQVVARSALCDQERPQLDSPSGAPSSDLEIWLAEVFREVLGLDRFGVQDDFLELGGNSVHAAMLANRLQQKLGAIVPPVVIFEAPTIARLAQYLLENYPMSRRPSPDGAAAAGPPHRATVDAPAAARLRLLIRPVTSVSAGAEAGRPRNRRAVFILSPPRSGSTLLRAMLAGHPGLFAPPELELLRFATLDQRRAFFSGPHQYWLTGVLRALMQIKGCDERTAGRIVRDCAEAGMTVPQFYGLIQEWLGGRMLVDKTPSYALSEEVLERAERHFDDARYIHLIRHPYGMIHSFEQVKLHLAIEVFFSSRPECPPRELAELLWLISHENILRFLARVPDERRHTVSFEHLVGEPRAVMEGVCDFLGIDFVADVLQPYQDRQGRMTDGIGGLAPMIGDPKFHAHQAIDATVADRWRGYDVDDPLGSTTWEMAERLGYPRREPPLARSSSDHDQLVSVSSAGSEPVLLARLDRIPNQEAGSLLGCDVPKGS
jgi:acyl-CoA synthetase (AMP-forming)/AMP-acid ligase II